MKDKYLDIPDCLRNQTNLVLELKEKLKNSVEISKLEELMVKPQSLDSTKVNISDLIDLLCDLQKLIDEANHD